MSTPRPPALLAFARWPLRARVALAMIGGFLLSVAFPPGDVGPLAFVSLVPLLLALRGATVKEGAVAGAAFGLAFFGVLLVWISLVGWLAWGVLVASQVAFAAAFGALAAPLSRAGAIARVVGWPLLYTGLEMARARMPLGGFTFGALGVTQHGGSPALPLARVGGMFAVTLLIVAVNALLAEAVATRRPSWRVVSAVLALGVGLAPAALPLGAVRHSDTADIAIVQGNVPRGHFEGIRRGRVGPEDRVIIENHLRLTRTLAADPPQLVIWPENALDRDPFIDTLARDAVAEAVGVTRAPLLVGAILDADGGRRFANSNLLFLPDGTLAARYDKQHLVPFGEYVPWAWARRVVPALEQIPSDGVAGREPVLLNAPGIPKIGAVVCFESTYPELVRRFVERGAEILVVTTNNATFERSALARQHLAHSRVRAVETGRPVLHAAISGISAVIRPDGSIAQQAGLFLPALLRQPITGSTGKTAYVAYGDAIELGLAAGAALAAIVALAFAFARRGIDAVAADDVDDDEFWVGFDAPAADDPVRAVGDGAAG